MRGNACAKATWKRMRGRAMMMAAVGALWIAPAAVKGTPFSWNINASGLFDTAANWSPAGPPAQ